MHPLRLLISMVVALGVTLFLFLFMHFLISGGPGIGEKSEPVGAIRFGPVEFDDELTVKQRAIPKKPPPPKEPPQQPRLNVGNVDRFVAPLPYLNMPKLDVPMSGSGPFLGAFAAVDQDAEGDIIPLVRIQPQYPRRAAIARIEGYVTIAFTITETGSVADPTVIESKPPRVFDREAIRAMLKWKFKPRVVDGVPVARRATQKLVFQLADA